MDYSDERTEAELIALEKKLNKEYRRCYEEMTATVQDYFDTFEGRYEAEYAKYKAGQYTDAQFKAWYQTQLARGAGWEAKKDRMARLLVNTNEIAAGYVNDALPSIFALNANYMSYIAEQNYPVSFDLVDEATVRNLMMNKGNNVEFKTLSVNPKRDYSWNKNQIQSALVAGIMQGKSIDDLAKSFMVVQERNRNAAVRNARTAVTSAQNAGRIDTMRRQKNMGIDVKKRWLATMDGRVRDSHAALNGQIRDIDKPFDNDLMYPGDSDGAPVEVYNCRCTLTYVYPKYQKIQSVENYSTNKQGDETYKQWLSRKKDETKYMPEYISLKEKYGLNVPDTYQEYVNLRKSSDYSVYKRFINDIDDYQLQAVTGYREYIEMYHRTQDELVGLTTSNGIEIKESTIHLTTRIFGHMFHQGVNGADDIPERLGVELDAIKEALLNPAATITEVKVNGRGLSQKFVYNKVMVSVNPVTGRVTQVNPK